jgi:outer membrane receptor protein involved in Fe transport
VQADAEHRFVLPRQVITLSGTSRFHHFDINVAPNENSRQEVGVVADTEIFLTDRVRLRAGGRFDWFSSFGTTLSPRIGLVVEPTPGHTVRASYNRAYVAPSFLENFLYFPTQSIVGLPTGPFRFPFLTQGNTDLDPLTNEAVEIGYTGAIGRRATVSVSVYRNESEGLISLVPTEIYTPASPPPDWPLPVEALAGIPLPKVLTELNLGRVIDAGIETSLDARLATGLSMYVNHSFQKTPDVSDDTPILLNVTARHRFNAGVSASRGRYFGSLSLSTASRAFWADIQPYTGWTERFTLINGTAGVRFPMRGGDGSLALKVVNVGDDEIRQHIFGDLLKRRVSVELRLKF